MESEIGGMNEEAVAETFGAMERQVLGCVRRGSERVRELGGHFALSLRVDKRGEVRWAYLSESTLGDRETEKCVLDLARAQSWPKPLGGEGLATRTFEIDPGTEPVSWDARRIRSGVVAEGGRLGRGKMAKAGIFVATAYVSPNGRVLSAGVAPPSESGEEAADCIAQTIEKLRFGSPGRRAAKVTFPIP